MTDVRLVHGDCLAILPTLASGSVDAIVTSPPYCVGKEYEAGLDDDAYAALLRQLMRESARILDGGACLFLNIDDRLAGEIRPVLGLFLDAARDAGLEYFDRRIWKKDPCWKSCQWHGGSIKSVPEFEYLYIFRKPGFGRDVYRLTSAIADARDAAGLVDSDLDRLLGTNGYGKKLTDDGRQPRVPSVETWEKLKASLSLDGSLGILADKLRRGPRVRLTESEWREWGSRSVWEIRSVRANVGHPAAFPVELASRAIRLLTDPGDLVVDPFAGSGSTLVACMKTGRRAIGIEMDGRYIGPANSRLKNAETPLFQGVSS